MGRADSWLPRRAQSCQTKSMSSQTGSAFEALSRGEKIRILLLSVVRVIVAVGVILWMYTLVPDSLDYSVGLPYAVLCLMLVLYIIQFRSQIGRIGRSRFPVLQSVEALIVTGAFFLTIFAGFYLMTYGEDPTSFSEPMTRVSALYFTVTVFATVGFGDIVAQTDGARVLVTIQMLLGLSFLAVIVKVFTGAAQKAMRQRRAQSSTDDQ
jgi:voltage-gated potassium channel